MDPSIHIPGDPELRAIQTSICQLTLDIYTLEDELGDIMEKKNFIRKKQDNVETRNDGIKRMNERMSVYKLVSTKL